MKNTSKKKKRVKEQAPFALIMTGYYPSTCDDIPVHSCDPCEAREFGRIRSAGFISNRFSFVDQTNPAEWQNGINEGLILVVPFTNGEMPEPSEKTIPGYGDVVEELVTYEFTAKYADPNFSSNSSFYNTLMGNSTFYFFFRTSSQTYITPVAVTIIPKFNVANDLNSEVIWNTTVKWVSNQMPQIFNTPDGIFDQCYELGE
jgi:hypothetical protein